MLNRVPVFFCLFILAMSVAGWAQESQTPAFRSRSDVVLIPVVVRTKQSPVKGLKPEQFSVFEDGKPQKIATVELIKTGARVQRRAAPGEFSNELNTSGPARLTIIGIDTINTPFLDQSYARQQVLKYIANSLDSGDQVAIFGMCRNGSVRMLHDITGDSAVLVAAIKAMTGALPNSATDTKTIPTYSKLETERAIMAGNKNPNLGTGDPGLSRAADEAQALQAFQELTSGAAGFELRRNMEATLESMHQIGEAYSAVPGRKSFIWITGSFPFDISGTAELMAPKTIFYGVTQDAGRYQSEHSGALPPLPDSATLVNDDVLTPLRHEFRVLLQQFAAANIVVYPVDARGLMTLNAEAADEQTNKLLQQLDRERAQVSQSSMSAIAKMTGGKTCYNKNEIASCVRDASHDAEQYYLVSYYRDQKNNKPGWRRLAVKVDQPDAEVRARTGYFYGNDPGDKNARTRELGEAARSNVPFGSVQFSARFLGVSPDGPKKQVKYEIYIPPETIGAADQDDNKIELELIAVASGAKDAKGDTVDETVGRNLPPDTTAAIYKQGIKYNNVLKLSPGEYKVHFIVRNAQANAVGSVIAPIKVE